MIAAGLQAHGLFADRKASNTEAAAGSKLRAKLGDDPANPRFIETEPGVGYRLKAE